MRGGEIDIGLIEGRNAVIEALRTEASIDKIFIQKGEVDKTLGHIASKARAAGIVVVEADRRKLDGMSRTHAHQGVIAVAAVLARQAPGILPGGDPDAARAAAIRNRAIRFPAARSPGRTTRCRPSAW